MFGLACLAALDSRRSEALERLADAVTRGQVDAQRLAREADLTSLRGVPDFERIVASGPSPVGVTPRRE